MMGLYSLLGGALLFLSAVPSCANQFEFFLSGYGESSPVETVVAAGSQQLKVKSSQTPKFAVDTSTSFPMLEKETDQFELIMERGKRGVGPIPYRNAQGEVLDKVETVLTWSNPGVYMIHRIASTPTYKKKSSSDSIKVNYVWVEEPPVELSANFYFVFIFVYVITVLILLQKFGDGFLFIEEKMIPKGKSKSKKN